MSDSDEDNKYDYSFDKIKVLKQSDNYNHVTKYMMSKSTSENFTFKYRGLEYVVYLELTFSYDRSNKIKIDNIEIMKVLAESSDKLERIKYYGDHFSDIKDLPQLDNISQIKNLPQKYLVKYLVKYAIDKKFKIDE